LSFNYTYIYIYIYIYIYYGVYDSVGSEFLKIRILKSDKILDGRKKVQLELGY